MAEEDTSGSVFLPQYIITEILCKLPVKTLLRFRSVCKAWRALISEPQFQAMQRKVIMSGGPARSVTDVLYLANCSRSAALTVHSMVQYLDTPTMPHSLVTYIMRCYLTGSSGIGLRRHSVDFAFPDKFKFIFGMAQGMYVITVGPFNGVFLLFDTFGKSALWNHATRDYTILWDSSPSKFMIYGFGLEEVVGGRVDFVVLKLSSSGYENEETMPQLYRSSTGTWKDVQCLPKEYKCDVISDETTTINGIFYWIYCGDEGFFLLTFDTRSESFGKMDLPNFVQRCDDMLYVTLSCYTLNDVDSLSVVLSTESSIRIWVMRECGERSYWVEEPAICVNATGYETRKLIDSKGGIWSDAFGNYESLVPLAWKTE